MYEITLSPFITMRKITVDRRVVHSSVYASMEEIPEPFKTKLSALRLVSPPDEIKNVGQRVDEHLFWVYEDIEY